MIRAKVGHTANEGLHYSSWDYGDFEITLGKLPRWTVRADHIERNNTHTEPPMLTQHNTTA